MRVLSAVAVLVMLGSSAQAATSLDSSTAKQLSRIEQRYFGQSYEDDTDNSRALRLEKLVFGQAVDGDPIQRIKHIVEVTNSAEEGATEDSASSDAARPAQQAAAAQPSRQIADAQPERSKQAPQRQYERDDDDDDLGTAPGAQDPYPHVAYLENAILGKSDPKDKLSTRLSHMEAKAFGSPSASPDFSQRTDALEGYVEKSLHKYPVEPDTSEDQSDNQQVAQDAPPKPQGIDYPRIDALEKEILGQSYNGEKLADRLSRMEVQAFGSASQDPDLSHRTDSLERYAVKKLHKQPFAEAQEAQDSDSGKAPGKSNQILSMVGKSLLGMAGIGGMGSMGGVGGPGLGAPGFGPSFGRGGRMRQRQANNNQDQQAPKPDPHPEDPAVHAPNPPPSSAKLITKVGWCEMQVFNHTFPDSHLEERLAMLNNQLNFAPGKSGVDLMDDVDNLMAKVVAQKKAVKSLATRSQNLVPLDLTQ